MIRRARLAIVLAGAAAVLVGVAGYLGNAAPAVPVVSTREAASGRPYVVKLHARWCPVCMWTRGIWPRIEGAYAGRVTLVVFDFTNDTTTEASRVDAARLGLGNFFDEYSGTTGVIVVLDGRSKEVKARIKGHRDFAVYREAVDAALRSAEP